MEQHFVDLLSSLPLHVVLLLAILGLWRDNRRLHVKIEQCLAANKLAVAVDENVTDCDENS